MTHSEQQAIESGDKVYLRKLMSLTPESNEPSDRMYDSDVLQVYSEETFKLSLPKEYGETVTLPLDMVYEIVIRTEDDIYRGQGRIIERFRDAGGDVCIFQLTTSLSRDAKKQYISCECKLPVRFCEQGGKENGRGILTSITIDGAVMVTSQYTADGSRLNMVFTLEGSREIAASAEVAETIRLRSGEYESHMQLSCDNIKQQNELARWILRQTSEEI